MVEGNLDRIVEKKTCLEQAENENEALVIRAMVNHFSCFVEKRNRGKDHTSWRKNVSKESSLLSQEILQYVYMIIFQKAMRKNSDDKRVGMESSWSEILRQMRGSYSMGKDLLI